MVHMAAGRGAVDELLASPPPDLGGEPAAAEEALESLGEEEAASDEDQDSRLERTASQRAAHLQIQAVLRRLEVRAGAIRELRERAPGVGAEARAAARGQGQPEALREAAQWVAGAQKQARDFGEDLLEDMLALDQLSGLLPEDRTRRKAALASIEGLSEEVDAAKACLHDLRRELEGDIGAIAADRWRQGVEPAKAAAAAAAPASAEVGQAQLQGPYLSPLTSPRAEQARAPGAEAVQPPEQPPLAPGPDEQVPPPGRDLWEKVSLPLRFRSQEAPGRYEILAHVPGLDAESLKVRVSDDKSTLTVRGVRLPTEDRAEEMQRELNSRLRRIAQSAPRRFEHLRKRLTEAVAEAYADMGSGEYGCFSQRFRVPRDVDFEGIEASCHDGLLRVTLPKMTARATARYPGHSAIGKPFVPSAFQRNHPFHFG